MSGLPYGSVVSAGAADPSCLATELCQLRLLLLRAAEDRLKSAHALDDPLPGLLVRLDGERHHQVLHRSLDVIGRRHLRDGDVVGAALKSGIRPGAEAGAATRATPTTATERGHERTHSTRA